MTARAWLLGAVIAAAIVLPSIPVRADLPEVRVEQVLALPALACLLHDWWRAGRPLRPTLLDILFLALGSSILASIIYAPLVLDSDFSARDGYEVVKIGLYWTLFRFGLEAAKPGQRHGEHEGKSKGSATVAAMRTLLVCGSLSSVMGVAQYYEWLDLNRWLTPVWAPEHHLRALAEDGRAPGTVGNPNYFGMLCVVLLAGALAWSTLRSGTWDRRLGAVALVAGTFGLVTSGSRGAAVSWVVAVIVVWAAMLLRRDHTRRLALASGGMMLAFALALLIVEVAPRGRVDYLTRMGRSVGADADGSLALRMERWRSVVLPWTGRSGRGEPSLELTPRTTVQSTGVPSAGAAEAGRDARRKADVHATALALIRYRAATGGLPPDAAALPAALVPAYLDTLPNDPSGRPYTYERTVNGFGVGAALEDPADPDFPVYGAGSALNYLRNGDLEEGGETARHFRTIPGTEYALTDEDSLYGRRAARLRGDADGEGGRTGLYQARYFGRRVGERMTATLWLKLLGPAEGELALHVNVLYTDGSRADPLMRVSAEMTRTGVWQKLTAALATEGTKQVDFVGVYLTGDGFRGEALVDGFALVDGGIPLSFPLLREAPPSFDGHDVASRLRDSPLLGVGPRKAEDEGTIDNEYLVIAARYGALGLTLYLALWAGVFRAAGRAAVHRESGAGAAAGVTVAATVAALLAFNLVAGSFLHLQLMGLFWPLAGVAAAWSGGVTTAARLRRRG